jgi:hypothetical protein
VGKFRGAQYGIGTVVGIVTKGKVVFSSKVTSEGQLVPFRKQVRFLLRIHQAELAKDPTTQATESSRSNLMAVQHTVEQMYGEAVAGDVANLATLTAPA